MRKYSFFIGMMLPAIIFIGCNDSRVRQIKVVKENLPLVADTLPLKIIAVPEEVKSVSSYIPAGYVGFDSTFGDLNKDGLIDCVFIIKGTDTGAIIQHESRGKLDRNRRGIIILLKKGTHYELLTKNYDCFSSENEEGGVYYPPELSVKIEKGNLLVEYAHGRYGYWTYTFRYYNDDIELSGYDASSNNGPLVNRITSINFLTHQKLVKLNTNEAAEPGEETYKDTWSKINTKGMIKLSEIRDFDEIDPSFL